MKKRGGEKKGAGGEVDYQKSGIMEKLIYIYFFFISPYSRGVCFGLVFFNERFLQEKDSQFGRCPQLSSSQLFLGLFIFQQIQQIFFPRLLCSGLLLLVPRRIYFPPVFFFFLILNRGGGVSFLPQPIPHRVFCGFFHATSEAGVRMCGEDFHPQRAGGGGGFLKERERMKIYKTV